MEESQSERMAFLVDNETSRDEYNILEEIAERYGKIKLKEAYFSSSPPAESARQLSKRGYAVKIHQKDEESAYALTIRIAEIISSDRYNDINLIAVSSDKIQKGLFTGIIEKYGKKLLFISSCDEDFYDGSFHSDLGSPNERDRGNFSKSLEDYVPSGF